MVRPVLDPDTLLAVAAQFGVALHLRGRRRAKAGRRNHPTREERVKLGFLSNELFPKRNRFGRHGLEQPLDIGALLIR
jgi:hypothetical protein